MAEKETLAFEEKAKQFESNLEPDDSDLSDLDELNILENKGIEYILKASGEPDYKLYVSPLPIGQYARILDLSDKIGKMSELEGIRSTLKLFSDLFKTPVEILDKYLTEDDTINLYGLLACSHYEGKRLFKKKKLPKAEYMLAVKTIRLHIRSALKTLGSRTI